MDLLGVLRACLRRWYVFLPIVVLTAWLARDQYQQAEPQYTATATVVIAPSTELVYNRGRQTESGLVVTSPFNGGDGPRVLAGLLARALNTATVREQLLPNGGAALTATRNVQEDATVVTLQVVTGDAATDAAALEAVRNGANGVLEKVQYDAGAPEGQLYSAVSGGPVDPPLVAYPDRVRGVVAIALSGLLLAVVLSVVAQSLLSGRRRRDRAAKKPKSRDAGRGSKRRSGGSRGSHKDDAPAPDGLLEELDLREPERAAPHR